MLKNQSSMSRYKKQSNIELTILILPALIYILIFNYLPMPGILLAFQNYNYRDGFFGSEWVGLKNFEYLFRSNDAFRIIRNTIVYNVLNVSVSMVFSLLTALIMDRVVKRWQIKTFQTTMFLPYFISWVVVSYMTSSILDFESGMLNRFLSSMGKEPVLWYSTPNAWWFIIVIANLWKTIGYSSIIYYGYILGIDTSLSEAAQIDGCTEFQRMRYITIPLIKPAITVSLIMSIGSLLNSDFGIFYFLTNDSTRLYSTTDVIGTYVFRAVRKTGDISGPAAIGMFQSVVGFILVITANKIIKHLDPENRIF